MKLPNKAVHVRETVYNYAAAQNLNIPGDLPAGKFVCLSKVVDSMAIYIYSIETPSPCSNVNGFHTNFPTVTKNTTSLIAEKAFLGIGKEVHRTQLRNYSLEYAGDNVQVSYAPGADKESASEGAIQEDVMKALDVHFRTNNVNLTVRRVTKPKQEYHLCPFSGGGDLLLEGLGSAVLLLPRDIDVPVQESPVYEDECRFGGDIELQDNSGKTLHDIILQLTANIILNMARKICLMISQNKLRELRATKSLSMYGITFGYKSVFAVIKVTVKFDYNAIEIEERYASEESSDWAIDCGISYVCKRLTKLPSPP